MEFRLLSQKVDHTCDAFVPWTVLILKTGCYNKGEYQWKKAIINKRSSDLAYTKIFSNTAINNHWSTLQLHCTANQLVI